MVYVHNSAFYNSGRKVTKNILHVQEKIKDFWFWRQFLLLGCVSVISRLCLGHRSVETWMLHQGGRGYPVHRFPIAMRLRDRKGRAILCIALNPHYGDSSGAILGVR